MKYEIPAEVPANPAAVEFPCDQNGITSHLQKAILSLSQRIHDQDQLDLVLAVYSIGIKHTLALATRTFADRDAELAGLGVLEDAE